MNKLRDIENPIVVDALWKPEPKVIGECEGCGQDIYSYEHYYDMQDTEDIVLIHQNKDCCTEFVANRSVCRSADD